MAKKVALGMSGGVDSSTSAKLLLEQGYEVTGFYLAGLYPGPKQDAAIADVMAVAKHLGIEAQVLDLGKNPDFLSEYFVETYRAGRTPNVCAICNRQVKFGFFYQYARAHGFDHVATGHYVRIKEINGESYLRTAADKSKDQSYFMSLVDGEVWSRAVFPVGEYRKTEIRKMAASWGIPVAAKAESMEVCFLQNQKIQDFLAEQIQSEPGEIVDGAGNVIGKHRGLQFYTIGQRKGLDIPPTSTSTPIYYVRGKDFQHNRLMVGLQEEVKQDFIPIINMTERLKNELGKQPDLTSWRVRIRHQGTLYPIRQVRQMDAETGRVDLAEPIFGVSPGQFAVFYQQDPDSEEDWIVMGAAEIDEAT